MAKGFLVSGQGEGSQHTGIAEIMSSEAGFVPQLFFNSEREEPEGKESGKQRGSCFFFQGGPLSSKSITAAASMSWPKHGHSHMIMGATHQ